MLQLSVLISPRTSVWCRSDCVPLCPGQADRIDPTHHSSNLCFFYQFKAAAQWWHRLKTMSLKWESSEAAVCALFSSTGWIQILLGTAAFFQGRKGRKKKVWETRAAVCRHSAPVLSSNQEISLPLRIVQLPVGCINPRLPCTLEAQSESIPPPRATPR